MVIDDPMRNFILLPGKYFVVGGEEKEGPFSSRAAAEQRMEELEKEYPDKSFSVEEEHPLG